MTTLDHSRRRPSPARRLPLALRGTGGLFLLAVVLAAIPWQLRWGIVADTSWIITICERLYAGERLYTDIVETNPPFSVWLYMPAYLLSQWLRVAPEAAVQVYAWAICAAGLAGAALVAQRARFAENAGPRMLLPAFLALLVLLPGNAFTQREHLGVALLGPLLVLIAWRMRRGERPHWAIAVVAGIAGSVIVLVKPHYALVVAAPAMLLAWRSRSLRPLFGPEYWTIGGLCIVYLGAVWWLHPEYVSGVLPLLSETYLQVRQPVWPLLQRYGPGYLLLMLVVWRVRPGLPLSPLAASFGAASLAAMAVFLFQAKGWPYHAYPAVALGLAAALCQAVRPPAVPLRQLGMAGMLLFAAALLANALPFMATQKPGAGLVSTVRGAVDRPTVALVGADIAAGHPLTRMVGGRWVSAYCSDWLGVFALYLAERAQRQGDETAARRYETIATGYTDTKLAELGRAPPDLLIVQRNDTRWRDNLERRQVFRDFIGGYRLLAQDDATLVYLRHETARPASSPASASD